jgi:ParB-like chromosome segregation protein Spo0J
MPETQRDARFESLFDRWNLTYEFVAELNLTDDLNVLDEAQVRNLANLGPSERVDQYALQMKNGAPFPPITIAEKLKASNNVMIDGNGRARAARKIGRTTFPAYVVSPIPDTDFAKLLAAALNQLGGHRLEKDEAYKAALLFVDRGYSDTQIAIEIGYSAESVRRWRREQQFEERIDRLQLSDAAERLSKTQKRGLAKILHDAPFTDVVNLVAETKPTPADLNELLDVVDKAASDDQALAAVAKAREEWRPIGPPPNVVTRNRVAQSARMHLGGLLSISDPAAVYDPTKAADDFERWCRIRDLVVAVLAVFEGHRGLDGELA